jgi:hypothetical protein
MKSISLQQLKANLQTEEVKRHAILDQGARGYKLGIEQRNNPRKLEGERKLWDIGWTKARDQFSELLKRNGGDLR